MDHRKEGLLPRLVLAPKANEVFRFDAQAVRDTRDVIEVTDDLRSIVDRRVVERKRAQNVEVRRPYIVLVQRQLLRIATERSIGFTQLRFTPTAGDRVHKSVGSFVGREQVRDLFPEVVRVRLRSVEAIVQLGGDYGQHLPPPSSERRSPEHEGPVQP